MRGGSLSLGGLVSGSPGERGYNREGPKPPRRPWRSNQGVPEGGPGPVGSYEVFRAVKDSSPVGARVPRGESWGTVCDSKLGCRRTVENCLYKESDVGTFVGCSRSS